MCTSFCDLVPHKAIKSDRMRFLEAEMTLAASKVSEYHKMSNAKTASDFYCDFVRFFVCDADFSVCGVTVSAEDASVMIKTKDLESEVMAGFSRLIQKLVRRSACALGIEPEELFGEAFRSFQKAMLYYNGEAKFVTFLHICLQRHLSKVMAKDSVVRVPDEVRKLTMRVVDRMANDRVSFDSAVQSEGLSQEKSKRVVSAMSKVCNSSDLGISESRLACVTDRPSYAGVRKVIQSANLGRLERAVVEGFMNSPTGDLGLSEGCRGLINPDTGKPYSRAALSSAWKKAREKLRPFLRDVA
jgi:hypothetical protein